MDVGALIARWKAPALDLAEIADAWRIFPRAVLFAYGYLCWDLNQWFQALKTPSTEQMAYVTAIVGLAVPLTGWYMSTGRPKP